ncbi:MAG: thioredoxin domain-containing protein, partial [Thermodesulfobacteriota bacterium]
MYNPVDWYPWGEEAREKARRENKPMLVSIGYSTCHWCHVMESESFEDPATAGVMNERFVSVKVDREERPEVDSLYMKAVQALTGRGGWPLNVFTTPDGVPFYGGTYFPPEDKHGLPAFTSVLIAVSEAYDKNRTHVERVTSEVTSAIESLNAAGRVDLGPGVAEKALDAARVYFDPVNGGFGVSTKFPHAMFLHFLLKHHGRTGSGDALHIVEASLRAMALGGIYDHVGGGFHRYSVDERWDVPHFEK